jgi:hypothetical protein
MSLSMDSAPAAPQPARSRRWLWIALIIALVVVLLAGEGLWLSLHVSLWRDRVAAARFGLRYSAPAVYDVCAIPADS